ncbi:hypothetical protein BUALT_Bualt02G0050800 [Buddleja alternifolia]|uniref:Cupin type-1 domain-containing protein n=1 Tax=Buddleja alternifolia TaxID=168488 RepID=A0AAV6Y8Q0_9LAMI|nr:hypothetical protein BUALT_Bualt02G0050800 [Buddleja alternifolia]
MESNRQNSTVDELFRNASWYTTVEDSFVRKLKIASTSTNWHNVVTVDRILCRIAQEMSVELRRHVSLNLLREKFKDLQDRYITFKRLTVWPGVNYCPRTNIMNVPVEYRDELLESVTDESSRNGPTDPWEIARIRSGHQEHSEQGSSNNNISSTARSPYFGEARVGNIYKDELVERTLKRGDIYRIAAGSAFYLINTAEGQRLHVICSIDASESLSWHTFQSFFIAGGTYPASVLSGFDHLTLSTAFNVSETELGEMLTRQQEGPIVYLSDSRSPSMWSKFLEMEKHQKVAHMRRIVHIREEDLERVDEEQPKWSFRKLLISMFGKVHKKREETRGTTGKGPDSYNIYDRKHDFENNYGWSIALDESDYSPLKHDDVGVYLVNLTAGSMMAPHINPRATEYGIVLSGAGTIQIVSPNGTLAMNAKVTEGNVFWIPRYFPFCQIASRTGPFEFFGFTTSARNNRPQFLVGANSLLHTMRGPEVAAAFGLNEDRLNNIIDAQRESVILPSATVAPPDEAAVGGGEGAAKVITSFGNDMVMGFD